MSLYSELTLNIAVYSDTAKQNCRHGAFFEDKVLDNTLTVSSGARVALAASASDQEVDLQSVANGQLIVLKSDSEFSVKFNGTGNAAITLKPQTSSESVDTPAFLAMLADGVTSIHLTNPAASAIEVDVGVAGI